LKMFIALEGAHAFCMSIFGRVEHLRANMHLVSVTVSALSLSEAIQPTHDRQGRREQSSCAA